MSRTKLVKLGVVLSGALMAVVFLLIGPSADLHARPNYWKEYSEVYKEVLTEEAKTTKCDNCHMGKEKRVRNDFGKVVGEKLGSKNVKDAKKVTAAIEAASKEASKVDGKTFGDLIESGKLPTATE